MVLVSVWLVWKHAVDGVVARNTKVSQRSVHRSRWTLRRVAARHDHRTPGAVAKIRQLTADEALFRFSACELQCARETRHCLIRAPKGAQEFSLGCRQEWITREGVVRRDALQCREASGRAVRFAQREGAIP